MSFLYVFALFCLMMGNLLLLDLLGRVELQGGCLVLFCKSFMSRSLTLSDIRVTMKLGPLGILAILFG